MIYYLLLVCMTFMASLASLFLKKSSSTSLLQQLRNINFYIGGIIYLIAAALNVYILRYLEYSVVMPLGALTYIWTLINSHLFLKEKVNFKKILGIGFICIGAFCVAL